MIEKFNEFVQKFDFNDSKIERKYYHSLRVKELSKKIAESLECSSEDIKLAEVIGILHDYGRFVQLNEYHTFNDLDSIDHGDCGAQKLFEDNEIANYWANEDDYDLIYNAIKYHNKLSIPDDLSERERLFCNIIRDADKLDILYIFSEKIFPLFEDGEISPRVKEAFDNEEPVKRKDESSNCDRIITTLALICDLNFKYSFEYLKESGIMEKLYGNINDKEKFKYYFDRIFEYIEEKRL